MAPENTPQETPTELRRQAEALARQAAEPTTESLAALAPGEAQHLLHELRVHQIELELQNEELRRAQEENETSRSRYFDLYDLAPVGYCTLDANGLIQESNLVAAELLGSARGALVRQPLSRFVLKDDQDSYYLHQKVLAETGESQAYDLRLLKADGTRFWAHLTAAAAEDEAGAPVYRVVLSDISERKRVEEVQAFLARISSGPREQPFFNALAQFLAQILGMDFVCIDRLEGDGLTARTLAVWCDGRFEDNVAYALKDTPCGDVVGKTVCCFPASVGQFFPRDQVLQDLRAESYVGVTLWSHTGMPIGLIAVIGRHSLTDRRLAEATLELVAGRAAGELESLDAEETLAQSHALLTNLAQLVPGVIYQYRLWPDGRSAFPYASPGMNDIYEVTPEQVREDATPAFGRLHPEDHDRVAGAIQDSARTLEEFFCEFRVNLPRQGLRWRWSQAHPQRMEDGSTLWHGIISDITALKLAEDGLRVAQAHLSQIQKLEALGSLAAGISHDLNNVMGAILGLASAREPATADAKDQRAYQVIRKACERGRDVLTSLLRFARPELSHPAPVELNALLSEVRCLLDRTTSKRIEIREAFAGEPLWVQGDIGNLSHALTNLSINAFHAMPTGGTLTLRTLAAEEGWVDVGIEDTGAGMTPEVAAHALEPFFTTKPVGEGTGLGLSMAFGVVKAHGGTLEIFTQPAQGTQVKIRLPRIPAPVQEASLKVHLPPVGPLRILLVDDDDLIRIAVAALLEAAGFQAKAVGSGQEALDSLRSGAIPDAIIMDMNMPGMDGLQALNRIRVDHPDLPVLIASGQPGIQDWPCFKHPHVAVIPKPFEMEEILAKLAAVVRKP